MSGSQITQFGMPPSYKFLASTSPNVLHTDNLPGNTLYGPTKGLSSGSESTSGGTLIFT
jgi:hypothetical protein